MTNEDKYKEPSLQLANPHDVETISNIVSEIRKDKKPYALKVAKELEMSSCGDKVLMDDAANCLRDDTIYIKTAR